MDVSPAHRAASLVDALSPRQREVLAELARGHPYKVVAHNLGLSERTVKMHRSMMLAKLGVRTTAEAVRIAAESGRFQS